MESIALPIRVLIIQGIEYESYAHDGPSLKVDMTDKGRYIAFGNESKWFAGVQKQFIVDIIKKNGGAIHLDPDSDKEVSEEYPVSCTMYGKHDYPRINITDAYLIEDEICVDGIDDVTGEKRTMFFVYPEHISDVFSFVGHTLDF